MRVLGPEFERCSAVKHRWAEIIKVGIEKCTQKIEMNADAEKLNQKFLKIDASEAISNPYLNTAPLCDNNFSFICVNQCHVVNSIIKVKSA